MVAGQFGEGKQERIESMRGKTAKKGLRQQTHRRLVTLILFGSGAIVVGAIAYQAIAAAGAPDPLRHGAGSFSGVLDIGVLVFREGLECVLVLAAIMAGMNGARFERRHPIALGVVAGFVATLLTWFAAVRVLDDLSHSVSALALQASTGLVAIVVLLIVMNWFFHKVYWTGWISLHNKRKRNLLERAGNDRKFALGFFWGMALLGFTSFYREGFEVVLFLQSYRLRLGNEIVLWGVGVGLLLSGAVALLTFVAHRRLPYRKMLVLTGILLGLVLVVMAGEQAQEMQLAHWLPTTEIPWLKRMVQPWMGLWLSIFPTVETLAVQAGAVALVLGSYFLGRLPARKTANGDLPAESGPIISLDQIDLESEGEMADIRGVDISRHRVRGDEEVNARLGG
jgi:high-affinity iron transporter